MRLDGPGSEERLANLQGRFRQLSPQRVRDRRVLTLAVMLFFAVVAAGLWLTA
jgi:hypothetical protein